MMLFMLERGKFLMIISKNDERKRVMKENFAPVFGGIDTDVT